MLYYARMDSISIRSAAIKLTDKILGYNSDELPDILKEIASEFGLFHVAHMRLSADKSSDTSVLTAVVTFPKEWQARYFLKQYITVDPVIRHARNAVLPYDWETLVDEYPDSVEFFADAGRHNIGSNGLSIPVRSLKNAYSVISFTSGLPKLEWEAFKKDNMVNLEHLAVLIDSAASTNSKLPPPAVHLSRREEQCLIWAARGKSHLEIAGIMGMSAGSVKTHLDSVRRKLHCINLTHAVGVAVAAGVIPASALDDSGPASPDAGVAAGRSPASATDRPAPSMPGAVAVR